ncbi:LamB/YcsF family protein [Haladaptatus salinisoli]|uniref:LamB/YcsF family protein n=1 Tax=Haladaptatus salinisoli TaxID=2884876 RepID=UPI001D09FC12|nr:5-oxoprolinase subunit PxpA [Haladaptatus salinisoli]
MVTIDINCDMGESFGNWKMGRDDEVMPYITSANIAGGYHAGDPHVMNDTVALAVERNVGIGIHPGLPDKMGFGRRTMDASPSEIQDYVIYQLGALQAFAEQHGATVQHVKPHGAMYSMLSESNDHARAVMEGILNVNEDLIYLATDMNIYEVAQEYDELRSVFEGYVDLTYRPDRSLIVEQQMEPKDPDLIAQRFLDIALDGEVEAENGEMIDVPAQSICIHGDGPNAVELLETIHEQVNEHDIQLVSLTEIA